MTRAGWRVWPAILLLNAALALGAAVLAPGEANVGHTTDRAGYEYVAAHPLAAACPHSIYCYRVLVPVALDALPVTPVWRWRGFAVIANALTGLTIAAVASRAVSKGSRPAVAAVVASIVFQTSFGATFGIFDPFTPDAAVYLCAAALALMWLRDRPRAALVLACVGVWAKEAVALVAAMLALAALIPSGRSARRVEWLVAAALPALLIVAFHVAANRWLGWSEAESGSADLAHGAWIARWLADTTLTPASRAFYLFIPFGVAWVYAALGYVGSSTDRRLKAMAIGTVILIPVLVYVQTPERALANAFFAVAPLAASYLARAPWPLAVAAAASNGLLTARVGLATDALPPVPYGLVLAASVGAVTVVWTLTASRRASRSRIGSSAPLASSR